MYKIDELVKILEGSEKPLILMGGGARKNSAEIIRFAERLEIPITTTWNAIDLIPYNHPLFIGRLGIVAARITNSIVQECDLLLSIGARLDPQTIAFNYANFAPDAKKILVDVDTAEAKKLHNIDLYFEQDAGEFIKELSSALKNVEGRYSDWTHTRRWDFINSPKAESDTISYQLCDLLSEILTKDDVLVFSTTGMVGGSIFPAFFRQKEGQRVILTSCGLGSMGGGIPAAIGVALASGKRVVCIDGDGSFMQNIQELEVVRRLNLKIVFIVVNNGGYASIRGSEDRAFGRHEEGMTFPDVCEVAQSFHIRAETIDDLRCVEWSSLHSVWLPLVIEVIAPHDEVLAPRVNALDPGGGIENMFPYKEK